MPELVPLSEELLSTMRSAAMKATQLGEQSITPRALLLALLDDPVLGPVLSPAFDRERLEQAVSGERDGAMPSGDAPAFKTPDGTRSVRLSREAYNVFLQGAERAAERYAPRDLALGLAARARSSPVFLQDAHVDPGALAEAIYKL